MLGAARLLLALQALVAVGPQTQNGRLQTETPSIHPQEFRRVVGGQAPYLSNNDVYEVGFVEGGEPLRGTGRHSLYSVDRDDWVRVRDLQVGERLQTAEGAVTVEALEKVRGVHRVYNLEVEGDPEYLVGEAGVRAHNTGFGRNAKGRFTSSSGGNTADAARGRAAHKSYRDALGGDYQFEVTLPSGRRADAVDFKNRVVRELKPDNPRAIQDGRRQLTRYRKELEREYGGTWTSELDTYKP